MTEKEIKSTISKLKFNMCLCKNIVFLGLFCFNTLSNGLLTESECFNQERVFIYNDIDLDFENAQAACQVQISSAKLAKIDSQEVFDFVKGFSVDTVGIDIDF